jgi:hypothetical protein
VSKELKKSEAKLEREARSRAIALRRVVQEYNEAIENRANVDALYKLKKQREIERVVAEYIDLHKSLKRIRRKLEDK